MTRNELREGLELLLEKVSGGVVFELAGLVVELAAHPPMKISGLLSVRASRKTIMRRKSYWTRPPPSGPGEADWIAIGFPAKGWFGRRDTQSMAFLSPPGREKLYSGVQKITPSAARIASAKALTGAGKTELF